MTSDDEPSTLAQRQLGRFLREARDRQGFTLDRAAQLVDLSKTALHRIETGRVKRIRIRDVTALCEIYDVDSGDTRRALDLAKQAQVKGWYTAFDGLYSDVTFNMFVGLAASARRITSYQEIVPGLMQTADYARALISDFYRDGSTEDIDRRVELRLKRQTIVTRKTDPVQFQLLLHESALHRMVGGPRVMVAQLKELAEASKRPNVELRVMPFAAGCAYGLLHGPFLILDFGLDAKGRSVEPPLVYFEGAGKADLYLESPDDITRYHDIASVIRAKSLDEQRSRDLLRRVARSFEA